MPLDAGGSDRPGELVLMLVAALVEEVDLVGGGDGDGRVYGNVGHCNADDALVVALEVPDLSL